MPLGASSFSLGVRSEIDMLHAFHPFGPDTTNQASKTEGEPFWQRS
jgi:hypothetical protein